MMKAFFTTLVFAFSGTALAGNSFVCTNESSQIDSDGYVHFVFDFNIADGDNVVVTDYADNRKKISTAVIEQGSDLVLMEAVRRLGALMLTIHRDQAFKPGPGSGAVGYNATLTYEKYVEYGIKCVQSGGIQLEKEQK